MHSRTIRSSLLWLILFTLLTVGCEDKSDPVLPHADETLDDINRSVANDMAALALRARRLDPTLCAQPQLQESVLEGVVNKLAESGLPETANYFYKFVNAGKSFTFKNASVLGKKPDISELTCSANLVLDGKTNLITFAVRPSLNASEGVVIQGALSEADTISLVENLTAYLANKTGSPNPLEQ